MLRKLTYITCLDCSSELLEFPGSDKLEGVRVTREGGAPGVLLFEDASDAIRTAISQGWQLGDVDLCVRCAEARLATVVAREDRTAEESSEVEKKRVSRPPLVLPIEFAPIDERDDPLAGVSIGEGVRISSAASVNGGETLIHLVDHGLHWIPEDEIHGDSEVYSASSFCIYDQHEVRGQGGEVVVSERYARAKGWL